MAAILPMGAIPRRLGPYRVLAPLGKGGSAEVYLARRDGEERLVALKVLLPHLHRDPRAVEMFKKEVRFASRLRHPGIVPILEVGEADGRPYIALELVFGETVASVLYASVRRRRLLPPALFVYVVAEAARALHAAHELVGEDGAPLGLVHRDVSPQNLMIGYDGRVYVLDFGIAKPTLHWEETKSTAVRGKIAYMAPEQILGEDMDRRADVFALGVILWEGTVGRRLFKTPSDVVTADRILSGSVPAPSALRERYPLDLEAVVLCALARDRAERYATADALANALLELVPGYAARGPESLAAELAELFPERRLQHDELMRHALDEQTDTIERLAAEIVKEREVEPPDAGEPPPDLATVSLRDDQVTKPAPAVFMDRGPTVLAAPGLALARPPASVDLPSSPASRGFGAGAALAWLALLAALAAVITFVASAPPPGPSPDLSGSLAPSTPPRAADAAPAPASAWSPPPAPPPAPPPPATPPPPPRSASKRRRSAPAELLIGSDEL